MVTLAGSRIRPNSCSPSVSQGKGLDLPQAIASALMEAGQGFHAEEVEAGIHITYRNCRRPRCRRPPDIVDALLDALRQESAPDVFREVPSFNSDDLGRDLRWELEQLRAAGISRVIAVDLTRPEFVIPVVRVVIPGLEGDIRHPHYIPGPRARRAAAP